MTITIQTITFAAYIFCLSRKGRDLLSFTKLRVSVSGVCACLVNAACGVRFMPLMHTDQSGASYD